MKNNMLHHNRHSTFNSMRMSQQLYALTQPDHICEMQAAFYLRTICEYAYEKCECKVNSARQNRHGSFQNIKPFNNKLYSSYWISVRQKKKWKTKRRKIFICLCYSSNDGKKIYMKSWKSQSICGACSFVYVFSHTTSIAQHFNEDRNLFDWALELYMCVQIASLFRLLWFCWMSFHRHFRHSSFHCIQMEFRMRSINKSIEYRDVHWKFIQMMVRRSFLFKQ